MTLCYLSPLWQVSSGHLKTLVTVSPHRFLDKFWQAWRCRLDKSRTAGGVFKGAGFGEGPVPKAQLMSALPVPPTLSDPASGQLKKGLQFW